jgi:sterol desaturase/sphingolipid hydroxylase (fatty acid hydroxylase superfamily)
MQLSKFDYYCDYVVYPLVIGALATVAIAHHDSREILVWGAAMLGGIAFWTLFEYLVHRIALHRYGMFVAAHAMHHAAPRAYIGTPTWISLPTYAGFVFLPLWLAFGFNVASGTFSGVMIGYTWYGLLHHLIHHLKNPSPLPYLRNLQAWHMRHHHSPKAGNFGVTTGLWDRLFWTTVASESRQQVLHPNDP